MLGYLLYDILFFAIPAILVLLFGISLYRYISAKERNKKSPGTFSEKEIKMRKVLLIIFSVIAGVLAAVVIGLIILLYLAVAYM